MDLKSGNKWGRGWFGRSEGKKQTSVWYKREGERGSMNLLENAVKADIMLSGGDFDELAYRCEVINETEDNAAKMYGILGAYTGNIEANIKLTLISMLYSTGHIEYWMEAIGKSRGLLDRLIGAIAERVNNSTQNRYVEAGSNIVLQQAVQYFTNYKVYGTYQTMGYAISFDDGSGSHKFIYSDQGYKLWDYKFAYVIEQDKEVILRKRWYNPESSNDRAVLIDELSEHKGRLIIERR